MCLDDGKSVPRKLSFDLKSPGFQRFGWNWNGSFDVKAWWSQNDTFDKHNVLKDNAFGHWFPESLTIDSCGSKEVNQASVEAADLLEKDRFNDYSFFGTVYELGGDTSRQATETCGCPESNVEKPTWPLIIRTKIFETPVVIAVGIIDYFETKYRRNIFLRKFSTMVGPKKFAKEFSMMWPAYFEVPPNARDANCDAFSKDTFAKAIASYKTNQSKSSLDVKPRDTGKVVEEAVDGDHVKVEWCSKICSSKSMFSSSGSSSQNVLADVCIHSAQVHDRARS
eukprot:TRINITY_DN22373_c0_g2_i1.p1 TRINITY_DN22373_c0_g2~~TRINITY_DN22373_c0_g2_i1.p1  ORF type:complete len:281 (+),score=34.66 TRINITY_DN22373_c0_g2_i1:706-1548(+)